jgi:hypothetical protein
MTDHIQKLVAAARGAETVLAEQHANCGGGTDTLYHKPLQDLRDALAGMPYPYQPDAMKAAAALAEARGWYIAHTGGRCTAFRNDSLAEREMYALVTDESGCSYFAEDGKYLVGLYTEIDGISHQCYHEEGADKVLTLEQALAWAGERLFEPRLVADRWQEL